MSSGKYFCPNCGSPELVMDKETQKVTGQRVFTCKRCGHKAEDYELAPAGPVDHGD